MRWSADPGGHGDPAAGALRTVGVTDWSSRRSAEWLRRAKSIHVCHDSISGLWSKFCLPHPLRADSTDLSGIVTDSASE